MELNFDDARLNPQDFTGLNASLQRSTIANILKKTRVTATQARELDKPARESVYLAWFHGSNEHAADKALFELTLNTADIPAPAVQPVKRSDSPSTTASELEQIKRLLGVNDQKPVDAEQVKTIVESMLQDVSMSAQDFDRAVKIASDRAVKRIEIVQPDSTVIEIKGQHHMFAEVFDWVQAGENIMLIGPAGSGKTTLAMNIAKALNRGFEMTAFSSQTAESKLLGYMDAHGKFVETALYRAYKNGWVFLADEVDNGNPNVITALNALLENGKGAFACGMIDRHPDFVCICAANTFGRGADRLYVGRNQLDAATLDRFANLVFDYDENLEREIALSKAGDQPEAASAWVDKIQALRKAAFDLKERIIISPRASIRGAKMIARGMKQSRLLDALVWKGIPQDTVKKITAAAGV